MHTPTRPLPRSAPPSVATSPTTHEELARQANAREHARHAHQHGGEFDTAARDDTFEPWADYDLGVMPRGV